MLAIKWTKSIHQSGTYFDIFKILTLTISLYTFDNGLQVLQLRSLNAEKMTDEIMQMAESLGSMDASYLAKESGISLILAAERFINLTKKNKMAIF